jgi:hypothetical protein
MSRISNWVAYAMRPLAQRLNRQRFRLKQIVVRELANVAELEVSMINPPFFAKWVILYVISRRGEVTPLRTAIDAINIRDQKFYEEGPALCSKAFDTGMPGTPASLRNSVLELSC